MKRVILSVALALLALLAGCRKEAPTPTQSSLSAGGTGTTPTQPSNQQALQDLLTAQLPGSVNSPGDGNNLLWPPVTNPNLDVYAVHVLWGTLAPGPTAPPPTDWSGSARMLPPGDLKVVAQISFDKGQDSLLPPSNTFQVNWVSLTKTMDVDGLSFLVTVDRTSPLTVIPAFEFNTSPVTLNLTVDKLKKLDTVIILNNSSALILVARMLRHESCPSGAVAGRWIKASNAGDTGIFEGQWMAPNATQSGFMTGNFWTTNSGRQFWGVYTDMNRNPVGYLKGTWRYDDPSMCIMCGSGHGQFGGVFTNLDTVAVGVFYAEIGDMTNLTPQLQLPYKGFWKAYCSKPETEAADL